MTVSAGLGIANFPFDDARSFRRWVDLCEAGGVDSIWQSDRLIGPDPNLECMSAMAWLAGATRRLHVGTTVPSPRTRTATGARTKGRGGGMDETLEIISRLWNEPEVTFSGRHFQLDRASI